VPVNPPAALQRTRATFQRDQRDRRESWVHWCRVLRRYPRSRRKLYLRSLSRLRDRLQQDRRGCQAWF
jgi:hypothetical protein